MENIYILRGKGTNLFKIGRTANPVETRVKQLQTGCPFEIEIHATFPTCWPSETERYYHRYLAQYRTVGEWFDVEPAVIDGMLRVPTLFVEGNGPIGVDIAWDGWQLVINECSHNETGQIVLGGKCLTASEIEHECLRMIQSLFGVIEKARKHEHILPVPRAPRDE